MLLAALRDLQWRRHRFIVAVLGAALVFAMGLLMSGLSNAFVVEVDRTLDQTGGDHWVAPAGAAGPFSAGVAIPLDAMPDDLAARAGVRRADPLLFSRAVGEVNGTVLDVNLFGVVPGGLGSPRPSHGRGPDGAGEILVASSVGDIGDEVTIFGTVFEVVGTVEHASLIGGTPSVFVPLDGAQQLVANGLDVASMIVTDGQPADLPPGLRAFDRADVQEDLARPLRNATRSIDFVRVLLWMVAALIVGSVVYLSALERTRDFAVFKASGVRTSAIGLGLTLQAVAIALTASVVGAVLAVVIAPAFPLDVVISRSSLLLLPLVAIVSGALASLVGLRRVATVQPAAAFGGP